MQRWLAGEPREDLALLFRKCDALTQQSNNPPDQHKSSIDVETHYSATVMDESLLGFIGTWTTEHQRLVLPNTLCSSQKVGAGPVANTPPDDRARKMARLGVESVFGTGAHILFEFRLPERRI